MQSALSPEAFQAEFHVSRETLDRLILFVDLLTKWREHINLVGRASLADVWRRHVLDSAQLIRHAPAQAQSWIDIGSGAGFPGLIVAILGARNVHLVESDRRKCAFLREAARITAAAVTVHACRVDAMTSCHHDVISARALAPLPKLLDLTLPFVGPGSIALFPKGQDVASELTEAAKYWRMNAETSPSLSDRHNVILKITELSRA